MKIQVEELSAIEKKLSIEVEAARVAEELSRAYATLSQRVKIPGFRPGKVPRHILEKRFREQVEDEVLQRVVQGALVEAVRSHEVDIVGQPQVTGARLEAGAPLAFEARVEVKPKLEVKDYEGLPLRPVEVKVEEADVDEQLERLRQSLSRLEPIADREVAQAGDFATVDYDATIDGQPFPGNKAEGVNVELAPGELVESNVAALEGVKVGESKHLDYAFPAEYQVEEVRGKTAHFVFQLKGLKRKVVPALDDELARESGRAQSLEELRGQVRSELEQGRRNAAQAEERRALVQGLLERNAFSVPRSMVERRIDGLLDEQFRRLRRMGVDPSQLQLDQSRLREDLRIQAELDVKAALVLEAVARQAGVQVSEEEVDRRIESLAADMKQPVDLVRRYFGRPEERRGLSLGLREEKTIEFLKARAKYSEG